jgi:peptidoglycan/xylan/chitin deacetylase (PgdA/CDA1 family)
VSGRQPFAVLSCDLDTVDRHLQGYGFEDLPPCDLVYRAAVPRVLELLDELGVPCVFFVIGRDAEAQRSLLRQIVERGHEIASHSLTHPQPFRTLDDAALREELVVSRSRLAAASGSEIAGFRAPAWDADARVLRAVGAAGYRYDASLFPTPVLLASRLAAYWRGTGKREVFSMDLLGSAFARIRPHRLDTASNVMEFPVTVTRWLRFPVYHTLAHLIPAGIFRRAVEAALRSRAPLCYEFHGADLLDLAIDRVDPRLARHPGMSLPLERKRAQLRQVLAAIKADRHVVTYRQALDRGLAA